MLRPLLAGRDAVHQVRDWVGDEFGNRLAGWKSQFFAADDTRSRADVLIDGTAS